MLTLPKSFISMFLSSNKHPVVADIEKNLGDFISTDEARDFIRKTVDQVNSEENKC